QALDGRDERDRGEDGTREGAAQDERTDQPYRKQGEQPRTGPRATARHRGQGDHQQRRRVERIDERLLGPQPVPRARHHTDRVRTPRPPHDQPHVGHLLRRQEEPGYAHVWFCLWGHTWCCNDANGTGTQGNVAVVAALVSEWLTWRTAMERALYGENGFYRRGERPAEHFRTSVHASPRFAAAIARLLVEVDELLGRPERLDVVDIGAGSGHLVSNILALAPPSLAARLAPTAVEIAPRPPDLSPRIDWRPDLPSSITGLAVANEWLDNIPLDVVEQTPDGVRTVLVDPSTGSERPGPVPSDEDPEGPDRRSPRRDRPSALRRLGIGDRTALAGTRPRRRLLPLPRIPPGLRDAHRIPRRLDRARRPRRVLRRHRPRRTGRLHRRRPTRRRHVR